METTPRASIWSVKEIGTKKLHSKDDKKKKKQDTHCKEFHFFMLKKNSDKSAGHEGQSPSAEGKTSDMYDSNWIES